MLTPEQKQKRREWYQKNKEKHYEANQAWKKKNPELAKQMARESYHRSKAADPIKFLLKHPKARALKKGLEFDLTPEDIVLPDVCPYFKVPLIWNDPKWCPTIDRINPKGGYTKDNIQIISHLANSMKWDASPEEMVRFAKSVLEIYGETYANPSG